MAMIPSFNAQTVEPMGEARQAIPTGSYKAMITNSEMKTAKTGGQYLEMQFTIADGEYKGSSVTERLNLVNNNRTTVEIAQRILSSICHAVGVLQVQDSQQLHNKPMIILVEAKEETWIDNYGSQKTSIKNNIKGYKTATGSVPVQQAQPKPAPIAPTFAPPQQPETAQAGGWNRGGQNPFGSSNASDNEIPF